MSETKQTMIIDEEKMWPNDTRYHCPYCYNGTVTALNLECTDCKRISLYIYLDMDPESRQEFMCCEKCNRRTIPMCPVEGKSKCGCGKR